MAEIRLYPVELGFDRRGAQRGVPGTARPDVGRKILENLRQLSEPYGTKLVVEKATGVIRVPAN